MKKPNPSIIRYVWKIWTATPYLNIGGKGWKRGKM